MHSLREFGKDLLGYIPSFVVPAVVSLAFIPLFTRYLTPGQWGDYVLVSNSIELLTTVSVSWLSAAGVRFYAQHLERRNSSGLVSTAITAGLFASLVVVGLVGAAVYLLGVLPRDNSLFALVSVGLWGLLGRAMLEVVTSLLRAQRKVSRYSALTVWQHLSRLAFGAFFVILLNRGAQGLLAGWALGLTIGGVWFGLDLFRQVDFKRVSYVLSKSMFVYGIPIVGGDIAFWLLRLSDRYILRIFRSAAEVGIYSVGVDLADRSLALLVSLLATSSWPLVVQTWETKGVQATAEFLTQLMRVYLLVALPATIGMALLSEPIMGVLADPAYHAGYRVIPFIALSVFMFGFQRWFQLVLALYEKTHWILISVLTGAVVNIVLNLLFVPSLGYMVAAVTTALGYAAFNLMVIWSSRRSLAWQFPYKSLVRALLASCVMSAGVVLLRMLGTPDWVTLLMCMTAGMLLYGVSLLALRELSLSKLFVLGRSVMHGSNRT